MSASLSLGELSKTAWLFSANASGRFEDGGDAHNSMLSFDAGSREVCLIRRVRTNTPLQALVLMNDPVYVEAAAAIAQQAMQAGGKHRALAARLFRSVLIRPPQDREVQRLVQMFETAKARFERDPAAAHALLKTGRAGTATQPAEAAAWTTVANVVLNLDETVMR